MIEQRCNEPEYSWDGAHEYVCNNCCCSKDVCVMRRLLVDIYNMYIMNQGLPTEFVACFTSTAVSARPNWQAIKDYLTGA